MLRKGYFTILGSLILVLTLTSCNIIPSQSENIATNEQGKVDNNVTEDVNDTENKYENSAISLPIPPILEDTNPDPTVADAFDAITTDRVYQRKRTVEEALSIMTAVSGKQFDPFLVKVFIESTIQDNALEAG